MNIGFLGLGAMGHAMARRLLDAGHAVTVYNRTASKADDLVADGARLARTPADAAGDAEIVFSMLFDDATTQAATFGDDGIAAAMGPDAIHVCCSTLSLDQARRLRDGHAERRPGLCQCECARPAAGCYRRRAIRHRWWRRAFAVQDRAGAEGVRAPHIRRGRRSRAGQSGQAFSELHDHVDDRADGGSLRAERKGRNRSTHGFRDHDRQFLQRAGAQELWKADGRPSLRFPGAPSRSA